LSGALALLLRFAFSLLTLLVGALLAVGIPDR
jgi:hypothetical protein